MFLAYPGNYPEEEWFDVEFESSEDWTDFYGVLLNHLPYFVQAVSTHFPQITGPFCRHVCG